MLKSLTRRRVVEAGHQVGRRLHEEALAVHEAHIGVHRRRHDVIKLVQHNVETLRRSRAQHPTLQTRQQLRRRKRGGKIEFGWLVVRILCPDNI